MTKQIVTYETLTAFALAYVKQQHAEKGSRFCTDDELTHILTDVWAWKDLWQNAAGAHFDISTPFYPSHHTKSVSVMFSDGREEYVTVVTLKAVPKGEYFKRKPDAKKVFIRGDYAKSDKKYECQDTEDMNRCIYLKGSTVVYIGFTY